MSTGPRYAARMLTSRGKSLFASCVALALGAGGCGSDGGDGGDATSDDAGQGGDTSPIDDTRALDSSATDTSGVDASGVDTNVPGTDATSTDTKLTDTGGGIDTAIDGGPTCAFTPDADGFFKLTSPKGDYWVRLPPKYDKTKAARLLFGFHGCGDNALNFATWAIVPYALRTTQDYIGASLGGRDGACWTISTDTAVAQAALAHIASCFAIDPKKTVLAGYSSGGGMAFSMGFGDAAKYAGILIENSGLSQAVGGGNVTKVLGAVAWKIDVAQSARIGDGSYAIAGIRADRDKMLAAGIPLLYRELDGTHDGTTDDWALYLIPKMATWTAP